MFSHRRESVLRHLLVASPFFDGLLPMFAISAVRAAFGLPNPVGRRRLLGRRTIKRCSATGIPEFVTETMAAKADRRFGC